VGLLQDGGYCRANGTSVVLAVSPIEEAYTSVVRTTNNQITVLLRESEGAQWRSRLEADFRRVRVVQVPDIGSLGHVGGHLLES